MIIYEILGRGYGSISMGFGVSQLSRFYGIEGVGLKLDADLDSQYNGYR